MSDSLVVGQTKVQSAVALAEGAGPVWLLQC
jgi:hypothetical protein